jgi:hypothetical protein
MENFLNHNIGFIEYITGNRFIDICDLTGATFCKTDYIREMHNREIKVLVTHNSDYHINNLVYSIRPKNVKKWFAQNKDLNNDNVVSIPIGLENMNLRVSSNSQAGRFSSQIKNALKKAQIISTQFEKGVKKTKLAYLNFNSSTYPRERNYVKKMFSHNPKVSCASGLSLKQYYEDVASHKFVISPRGNGVDCHRTWEALYLKSIPIIRNTCNIKEFSELPILFVDKWEDLSYINLEETYEQMMSKKYDLRKMKISYWEQIIRESLNE